MTSAERADAMGYGRCCARCRWYRCDLRREDLQPACHNDKSDAYGQARCLGDICGEWEEREVRDA